MDVTGTSVVEYFRHQRLFVDYLFVSAVAVFVYDYFLTLHLEIKFIWFSRWTLAKLLYLFIRYMAVVVAFLIIHNQIFSNVSEDICRVTYPMATWVIMLQIFLSEGVLYIRTWAIWLKNKAVGIGLAVLMLAHLVLQCVVVIKFVRSFEFAPPPFHGFRGCLFTKVDPINWISFVAVTIIQSVVLALMVISAVRSYRRGITSKFIHVIYKDGILFYIYLLCFTAANLVVSITMPVDMMFMLTPLHDLLHALLTTRIILSIRDVGSRDSQSELHISRHELPVFAKPLLVHDEQSYEDDTTLY